jgi:ubiquinone/menaquinone biosynthesis C-methylase UbiE
MTKDIEQWWNQQAEAYQDDCNIPVDILYGPGSPNEDDLNLLGELTGKQVLELGCGGGQSAVAFALKDAQVTAIDIAEGQLAFARNLAAQHRVQVDFIRCDFDDLTPIATDSQDIVFSAFALMYAENRLAVFREAYRVLKPGGVFVFSVDHPFFRKVDAETLVLVESYHETGPAIDDLGELGATTMYRYRLSDLHNTLVEAHFMVQRIIEPDSRIRYDYDPWYGHWGIYLPKVLDMVPPTVIFKAIKPRPG